MDVRRGRVVKSCQKSSDIFYRWSLLLIKGQQRAKLLTQMTLPSACLGLTLMEFTTFRYVLQSNFGIKLQTMQKFSSLQQGTFNMTMMTFFGKKKRVCNYLQRNTFQAPIIPIFLNFKRNFFFPLNSKIEHLINMNRQKLNSIIRFVEFYNSICKIK